MKKTIGPISAVQCPHCGKHNDMRALSEQHLLEQGAKVDCDHCKQLSTIVAIDTRPRVVLGK